MRERLRETAALVHACGILGREDGHDLQRVLAQPRTRQRMIILDGREVDDLRDLLRVGGGERSQIVDLDLDFGDRRPQMIEPG